jgi:hypothetical protein
MTARRDTGGKKIGAEAEIPASRTLLPSDQRTSRVAAARFALAAAIKRCVCSG